MENRYVRWNKSLNLEQSVIYQNLTELNCKVVFTSKLENVDENRIYFE